MIKPIRLSLLLLFFFSASGRADSFCFASAGTYYEQVYCELQAKGEAKGLPAFYQFKRNSEQTQALLLKRPAARLGIDLPKPKAATAPISTPQPALTAVSPAMPSKAPSGNALPHSSDTDDSTPSSDCEFSEDRKQIGCGARVFRIVGNRRNSRLADGALLPDNKMALPVFDGNMNDPNQVNHYLTRAYEQYLEKMHAIGLGGVTTTYAKFHFLFFDVQDKGLDFSQRFETMYSFLKQDKATMGVSETASADAQLTVRDCDQLGGSMLVCARSGRNYLYLSVSE